MTEHRFKSYLTELSLIELVRKHEVIYNTKCPEHRDSAARHEAWAKIAKQSSSTVAECKHYWSKLRNCYTNAKLRRTRKSHNLEPWKYELEMSFLDPHLKERPPAEEEEVVFVEDTWESPYSKALSTSDRITANIERERLLIDLIRRYEVIYNTKCSEYRNVKERRAAWIEIADLHGSTVEECKETWVKLRNCYTNAMNRHLVKCAKNLPIKPWRFDKEMSFLRPHLNLCLDGCDNSDILLYEDEDSWGESSSSKDVRIPESGVTSSYKRKATDFLEVKTLEENTSKLMFDDLDHFFLSMSKMTKKLPKIDQLRIKLDLHKAINEAELRLLEQSDDAYDRGKDSDFRIIEVKQEVSSPAQDEMESQLQELKYLSYN